MEINTQKYGLGSYKFEKRSLLTPKTFLDLTDETSCNGFVIEGTEPAGTSRRIIFKIEDVLYRFVNGILDRYEWRGELDDILQFGNSVGELLALENIPAFVGKKVFPIVALAAPYDAVVMPKIKIAVKVNSYNDIYTKYEYSPVYDLGENAKVLNITESKHETGNATSYTQCRLKKLSGWSDWQYIYEVMEVAATQVQFRTNYTLTALDGTDEVTFEGITINYITNFEKIAADFKLCISNIESYDADLKTCYLLINHEPLIDAEITAYAIFGKAIERRENVIIGVTAGLEQTLYLPDKFILQDTLHLELEGKPFFDFDFDTEKSALYLEVEAGQTVTASYDFTSAEMWQPMSKDYSNATQTRFTYRTLEGENRRAGVAITITKKSGIIESDLGSGTGKLQLYPVHHNAEVIECNAAWKYNKKAQLLSVVQKIDQPITLKYNYRGKIPEIKSYVAGFSIT